MTVTWVPRAAKREANSMPMTPPPMTARDSGIWGSSRIWRLVRAVEAPGMEGTAGRAPVAMRILSAL